MQRIPEPELMDDPVQALAYALADFSASHGARVAIFRQLFPQLELTGAVLDLGCGSGDVLLRFARAFPRARFFGVDGSRADGRRSRATRDRGASPNSEGRVQLIDGIIPDSALPREPWQLIMCHSLLHQLHRAAGAVADGRAASASGLRGVRRRTCAARQAERRGARAGRDELGA